MEKVLSVPPLDRKLFNMALLEGTQMEEEGHRGCSLFPRLPTLSPLGKHTFPIPKGSTLSESSLLFPLWWIFSF